MVGKLYVIGGARGCGKTTLARQVLLEFAWSRETPVNVVVCGDADWSNWSFPYGRLLVCDTPADLFGALVDPREGLFCSAHRTDREVCLVLETNSLVFSPWCDVRQYLDFCALVVAIPNHVSSMPFSDLRVASRLFWSTADYVRSHTLATIVRDLAGRQIAWSDATGREFLVVDAGHPTARALVPSTPDRFCSSGESTDTLLGRVALSLARRFWGKRRKSEFRIWLLAHVPLEMVDFCLNRSRIG